MNRFSVPPINRLETHNIFFMLCAEINKYLYQTFERGSTFSGFEFRSVCSNSGEWRWWTTLSLNFSLVLGTRLSPLDDVHNQHIRYVEMCTAHWARICTVCSQRLGASADLDWCHLIKWLEFVYKMGCWMENCFDQDILLQRLNSTFGMDTTVLLWIISFLTELSQQISHIGHHRLVAYYVEYLRILCVFLCFS